MSSRKKGVFDFEQHVSALKMLEQGRTAESVADHLVVVEHKFRSILV